MVGRSEIARLSCPFLSALGCQMADRSDLVLWRRGRTLLVRRQLLRFGRAYLPWLSLGETERARDKQNQKRRQGSWLRIFREGVKERALLFLLLHTLLNEFAVVHQFADQGIDLLQVKGACGCRSR
jgi:hypothetical protein